MGEIKRVKIKRIEDLYKIKSAWEKLETGDDMTAFQEFNWNCLLFEKWKSDFINRLYSKCFVYLYKEKNNIRLIAPIIYKRKTLKNDILQFERGIYFLGDNTHSDYLNFIYQEFDDKIVFDMIQYIKKDLLDATFFINKIRSDIQINYSFRQQGVSLNGFHKSVCIRIPESIEQYTALLSKNTKQNLRTAKNRMLKADFKYTLEHISGTVDYNTIQILKSMHENRIKTIRKKEYEALNSAKYKKRLLKLYKHINAQEKKYDLISNSMSKLKNSVFIIVKLNGKIVSYLYGLKERKAIRIIHNCFDEEYSFYSPMFCGSYDFIVDECKICNYDIEYLDFTLGDETYKFKLGGTEIVVNNYIV